MRYDIMFTVEATGTDAGQVLSDIIATLDTKSATRLVVVSARLYEKGHVAAGYDAPKPGGA